MNTTKPKSVLFVCMANVIRSPLCEEFFRKLTEGKIVTDSAAVTRDDLGHHPYKEAQTVAQQNGFDISGHIARLVTKEDFHKFDLIVSVGPRVTQKLEQVKPEGSTAKIIELIPGKTISNPWNKTLPFFFIMFEEIKDGMEILLDSYFPEFRHNLRRQQDDHAK